MGIINKVFRKWRAINLTKKRVKDNELEESFLKQDIPSSSEKTTTISWSSLYKKEDWWAVWIGLIIFSLSLPSYFGVYLLGWIPIAKPWTDISHALSTKSI